MQNALIFGLIMALILCLLPGMIASSRNARDKAGIWGLSLVGGWTVFGWVAAFVWACVSPVAERQRLARKKARKYKRNVHG